MVPENLGKNPNQKNSGPGRAGFHLIKFQVSQVTPQKTRKIRVGSGFGDFRVFAHSTLQICAVKLQWKCIKKTVILKNYSSLLLTLVCCIFYKLKIVILEFFHVVYSALN
jgi:hypothetical protein